MRVEVEHGRNLRIQVVSLVTKARHVRVIYVELSDSAAVECLGWSSDDDDGDTVYFRRADVGVDEVLPVEELAWVTVYQGRPKRRFITMAMTDKDSGWIFLWRTAPVPVDGDGGRDSIEVLYEDESKDEEEKA